MYRGVREEILASQSRRRYLEKVARLLTRTNIDVQLDSDIPSGLIDFENGQIRVSSQPHDQPVTNLDPKTYDMLRQEGHLIHEIGHALYTDHPDFKRRYRRKASGGQKDMFGKVWNLFEDGALERQLMKGYNVATELKLKNANMSHREPHEVTIQSFRQVLEMALFDLVKFNSGVLQMIRDGDVSLARQYGDLDKDTLSVHDTALETLEHFIETGRDDMVEIVTEPNAQERNRLIEEFFDDRIDPLMNWSSQKSKQGDEQTQEVDSQHDDDTESGSGQEMEEIEGDEEEVEQQITLALGEEPEDGEEEEEEEEAGGSGQGDQDEEDGDEEREASGAGGEEGEEEDEDGEGDGDEQDGDGDEQDGDDGEQDGDGQQGNDPGEDVQSQIDEEEIEQAQAELEMQMAQEGMDDEEVKGGFETMKRMVEEADTSRSLKLTQHAEEPDPNAHIRYKKSRSMGQHIRDDLKARLQREQREKIDTHRYSGEFDDERMIDAARGAFNIFRSKQQGEEKDYQFIGIIDRSGSTAHDSEDRHTNSPDYDEEDQIVFYEEEAMGAMVFALEELGIDTMVIDMYASQTWVTKHFHETFDQAKEKMFHGETSGRTPIHAPIRHAMQEAREQPNPFIMVVTDGKPDSRSSYRDALDDAICPVLGVYVRPDMDEKASEDNAWFHQQENCTDPATVSHALQRLTRKVLL